MGSPHTRLQLHANYLATNAQLEEATVSITDAYIDQPRHLGTVSLHHQGYANISIYWSQKRRQHYFNMNPNVTKNWQGPSTYYLCTLPHSPPPPTPSPPSSPNKEH